MPLEAGQECRKALPAACEDVSAFGEFFNEHPSHVPSGLNEAISPHLADTLVKKMTEWEASASGLLHVRRD